MALDIATFRIRFPEFANDTTYTDVQVQLRLDDAALQVDPDKWSKLYELGVMHLAAHYTFIWKLVTQGKGNMSLGPVTAETVNRVSYTLGVNSVEADAAFLASSPYGMEYLRLLRLIKPVGFFVVT